MASGPPTGKTGRRKTKSKSPSPPPAAPSDASRIFVVNAYTKQYINISQIIEQGYASQQSSSIHRGGIQPGFQALVEGHNNFEFFILFFNIASDTTGIYSPFNSEPAVIALKTELYNGTRINSRGETEPHTKDNIKLLAGFTNKKGKDLVPLDEIGIAIFKREDWDWREPILEHMFDNKNQGELRQLLAKYIVELR